MVVKTAVVATNTSTCYELFNCSHLTIQTNESKQKNKSQTTMTNWQDSNKQMNGLELDL